MALDFTCLQTRKANSRSASSASVGARFVTTLRSGAATRPATNSTRTSSCAGSWVLRRRPQLQIPGVALLAAVLLVVSLTVPTLTVLNF